MTFPLQIGCCSIAMRDSSIFEAAQEIAKAGFTGIEIWYPHIEKMSQGELSEVVDSCANLGLNPTVIAPYFSFTRGPARWEESIKCADRVLQAAKVLGVKKVRTFIDCGSDGISSEEAQAEHWIFAREGLRKLCGMDPETQFVLETHEHTLANTLPSVCRLLEEVEMPNLRVNYQATHDFLSRGYLGCLAALYPAVNHMHWEQIRPDQSLGYLEEEGAIDFAALIDFLRAKEYQGTISVEYCWTPVDVARIHSTGKYLAGLIFPTGQTDLSG